MGKHQAAKDIPDPDKTQVIPTNKPGKHTARFVATYVRPYVTALENKRNEEKRG